MASTRHPALVGLRTETRMPRKQVIAIVDDDECAREGTIDLVKSMGFIAKAFPHPLFTRLLLYRKSSARHYLPLNPRPMPAPMQGISIRQRSPFGSTVGQRASCLAHST